jgi:hypothetical protein
MDPKSQIKSSDRQEKDGLDGPWLGANYLVAYNGNWGPECTCGPTSCLNDVDGAEFVYSMPPMMETYYKTLIRQVHAAAKVNGTNSHRW